MQNTSIAVLGAGMVGRAIALDLAGKYNVCSFDISESNLSELHQRNNTIAIRKADLKDTASYADWLAPFDLVITAVPGFMGFKTLEAVIACSKNVVDISFFAEDAMALHELAIAKNVTVITDCGVAPGMSNLIVGRYNEEMTIESFACYVGGLPKNKKPPFEYKAPFSPIDVIEEYVRPARMVENNNIVTKPALSDREMIDFSDIDKEVGVLEAFNTDGLRSLIHTMRQIPQQKEKTLRYPGHIELIETMKKIGLFGEEKINVNGLMISPLEFSTAMLLEEWKLGATEEEFTIMQVIVKSKEKTIDYTMIDRYDPVTQISSMSRTTGYTCTAAAELIINGMFTKKGVFPPELVGSSKACFDYVINYLKERKVNWNKREY